MDASTSSQGNTSAVSSRREKRTSTRAAKQNINGNNVSASAQQRAIDAEGSLNRKTRMVNGGLEYRSDSGWIPAIYHDNIRAILLAEGPQGTYDVPRKQGKEANDVTSFHPAYKTNGQDRKTRHKILFRYKQDGYPVPSYIPETWMYRGRIVLDPEDDPVRKWLEIPLVLSSQYEGYDMEVVRRLNPNISFRDFRARMPRSFIKGSTRRSSWGLSTLSMRNTRFRLAACCLAWTNREGSDILKAYLDTILPQACHAENSTEGFRDLTNLEVKRARESNKGSFLKRAGGRALDEATRQERNRLEEKRSENLEAKHNEMVGAVPLPALVIPAPQRQGEKRKRQESLFEPEDEGENTRPPKRQQRAVNIDPTQLDAESSGDGNVAFHGPELDFDPLSPPNTVWKGPNDPSGLGQVNSPRHQGEGPELQIQNQNSDPQEFGLGEGFSTLGYGDGRAQAEHTPHHMEQLAVERLPLYFNGAQWQAFTQKQLSDNEVDFRFIHPTNQTDEISIHIALHYTRANCRRWLGVEALDIPSTPWETYAIQYLEINEFFKKLWGQYRGDEAPQLFFLEAWTGGFDGWETPSKEEL